MNLILRLDTGNHVIDRSTRILRQESGFEVITEHNMLYKLAEVGADGKVIVNGHGCPSSFGGKSPTELAALLAKGGLKGPVEILLIGCNTGWGGAPYALNLKVELVQSHKIMCSVAAPTHYIAVQDDATVVVLEKGANRNWSYTPDNRSFYETSRPWKF